MATAPLALVVSHWHALSDGVQASSQSFYVSLEAALAQRGVPEIKISRVQFPERSGPFAARRDYLRVKRRQHIFDVCAAPFGTGFFVSWWLSEKHGWLASRATTYYQVDTTLMFQDIVHTCVLEVVDQLTTSGGVRALSELERKPIMRELYGRR